MYCNYCGHDPWTHGAGPLVKVELDRAGDDWRRLETERRYPPSTGSVYGIIVHIRSASGPFSVVSCSRAVQGWRHVCGVMWIVAVENGSVKQCQDAVNRGSIGGSVQELKS